MTKQVREKILSYSLPGNPSPWTSFSSTTQLNSSQAPVPTLRHVAGRTYPNLTPGLPTHSPTLLSSLPRQWFLHQPQLGIRLTSRPGTRQRNLQLQIRHGSRATQSQRGNDPSTILCFSSSSRYHQLTEGDDAGIRPFAQVVLGQEINGARVVTLNRPRQLNGINDRVVRPLGSGDV